MTILARPSTRAINFSAITAAVLLAWLALRHYDQGKSRYDAAQRALDQAAGLAEQIALLRQKPDRAATQSRSEQSLAEAIEKSAAGAGVAREQIARVEPQTPRRASDADYLEYATVVQLDGVTLSQLAKTVSALRNGGAGVEQLRVSALRIAAPYQATDKPGNEPWNVELTLTYLVYSPKNAPPRKT